MHRSSLATIVLALGMLVAPVAAQPPLFGPLATFSAAGPRGIAIVDLNGDGNPDLALSGYGSAQVLVCLGDGNGGFGAPTPFAVGLLPYFLSAADLNGDGKIDLVTANGNSNDVSVLLGDGTGGFGSATSYATANSPVSLAIADLNGDARPDLVTSNFADPNGTVSVLLGTGGGAFAAKVDYPSGRASDHVVIGDWNSDGKPDLAVTNRYANQVALLLGDGLGGFTPGTSVPVPPGSPATSAVADMNGDGKSDLVVTTYKISGGAVSVFLGDGAGGFVPAVSVIVGTDTFAVAAGDLNADGKTDVVVGDGLKNANSMYALLGDGTGNLVVASPLPIGSTPMYIALGDVDRDGRLDVVTPQFWDNRVAVLRGVSVAFATTPFSVASQPRAIATADVTGDGRLDLLTANFGSDNVSLLTNNGGSFTLANNFPVSMDPVAIAVGDLDNDGKPDAVTAHSVNNKVSVLRNNASGGFLPSTTFSTGSNPIGVAIVDVNADGKRDVVTINAGASTMSVLLGNGAGSLGTATHYPAGGTPTAFAIADFDRDGDPDVVVGNSTTSTIALFKNNGAGTFSMFFVFAVGGGAIPTAMAAGDVNGDGKPDLVVIGQGFGSELAVCLGDGAGGFSTSSIFAQGPQMNALALGDVNGDGKPDVAVASSTPDTVAFMLGDGAGNFTPATTFSVGTQPFAVAIADWNADGNLDVASANFGSNDVSVISSQGVMPYGTGTSGFYGALGMSASTGAHINRPTFALMSTNAPRRSAGVTFLATVPDVPGTIIPGWDLRLQVSLAGAVIALGATSDAAGEGRTPLPLPNAIALIGLHLYAQSLWFEDVNNGLSVSHALNHLVSSRGLAMTLLP